MVADIISGDTPSPFPATGENIDLLNDNDILAMGVQYLCGTGRKSLYGKGRQRYVRRAVRSGY